MEAGRCLRLYPRNRVLAHPSVRWNYLPALERHLGEPHFTPDGLLLGPGSVTRRHFTALQADGPASVPRPTPAT
ncbi:hypothetical protein [Streptomyces natalensis]|uniref:hypothetical protein n=1 Tax=Streptomyces natalensis TaxID=68242 RepID=UPI0004A9DC29|nr:hypothetical protein [Streptomyces natalensis]